MASYKKELKGFNEIEIINTKLGDLTDKVEALIQGNKGIHHVLEKIIEYM